MSTGLPSRVACLWALVACLALPAQAWAAGPLQRDHPLVEQGREAYAAGNYEEALKAFEAAKKERPGDPAVDFNRGDALAKLGRVQEAEQAFRSVTESNRDDLRQKAWYNLGNLKATTGDKQEALKSYRRALTLDPKDLQARHNYEVVLRDLPPPDNQSQPDGGADGGQGDGGSDGGRPDAGQDGGTKGDGGTPTDGGMDGGADGGADGGQGDGGADGGADGGQGDGGADGGQGDGGADGGQQGPQQPGDGGADGGADGGQDDGEGDPQDGGSDGGSAGEQDSQESSADGGVSPEDLDRQEAERLLDAMKQNEKNLQLWRFQQKKKQRKPNEKDW